MEPVTAAIVAALGALGSETAKASLKVVVKDAYDGLKEVIHRKWGADSAVAQSVAAVEKKPQSKGLADDLAEEVGNSGAANDAEVAKALLALTAALAKVELEGPTAKAVANQMGIGNIESMTGGTNTFDMRGGKT